MLRLNYVGNFPIRTLDLFLILFSCLHAHNFVWIFFCRYMMMAGCGWNILCV